MEDRQAFLMDMQRLLENVITLEKPCMLFYTAFLERIHEKVGQAWIQGQRD